MNLEDQHETLPASSDDSLEGRRERHEQHKSSLLKASRAKDEELLRLETEAAVAERQAKIDKSIRRSEKRRRKLEKEQQAGKTGHKLGSRWASLRKRFTSGS